MIRKKGFLHQFIFVFPMNLIKRELKNYHFGIFQASIFSERVMFNKAMSVYNLSGRPDILRRCINYPLKSMAGLCLRPWTKMIDFISSVDICHTYFAVGQIKPLPRIKSQKSMTDFFLGELIFGLQNIE